MFLLVLIWEIPFEFSIEEPIYFLRSVFNSSRETYLSLAKENKDVSSPNILHVKQRPPLKSFIYIKNKRGPRTEPCGKPDFIVSQEEL